MTLYPVEDTEALRAKFPQAFRSIPPMLAGTVLAKPVRCGKPSCRCAAGEPHGPYFYHSRRVGGRIRNTYVPKAELPAVVAMCLNRRAMQAMARENRKRQADVLRDAKALIRDLERWRSGE